MDLMIESPGNGVVPRQCFGQIPQLFMGASPEQGLQTFVTHREAVLHLQHVKQDRDWHGVQHQRLQRAHHLEQQH